MNNKIGFMQGRLSPMVDGKVQAFPWSHWKQEFNIASKLGFEVIEWTLDQKSLYENPLMTAEGQITISQLKKKYNIDIPSLTGDCFMQAPFWKVNGIIRKQRQEDLLAVIEACSFLEIKKIIIPLVDNGSLEDENQTKVLLDFLNNIEDILLEREMQLIFESDYDSEALSSFIKRLDPKSFGINYDIGNSAALGFNPLEEITSYGERIYNTHVKDRVLNGNTVPLGDGNADFNSVFKNLNSIGYQGNYILQTARSKSGDHSGVLIKYKRIIETLINNSGTTATK